MATFYKFGKLFEIPPAAARLGKSLPANTQAFETFLTNLEPMYSAFICAHPRCPKDPDLPAVRYAIKAFMEAQAPSNFCKERWAASYDPARKVTYVSWFLGTVAYFLDKLDFTTLVSPPVETKFPVFISEPPSAPLDPAPPPCNPAPVTSSSSGRAERTASRIGAVLLFTLAAYIVAGAAWSLWTRHGEAFSLPGLIVALLAMPIMTLLARRKIAIATQLGSRAMRADAAESITCGWLSLVVVVGLLADLMLGAWWVDAVTSLVIVGFVVKEAREAWSGEDCCDHD